ncbi:MAG: hypothetical protein LBJ88_02590 [Campylobacteraceae bacterium]|jgi:hypothetical protein|nr:hypothetical protein [Campylobacteraceae bacterium]
MSTQNIEAKTNEYELNLKQESEILLLCQNEKNIDSCFVCENIYECEKRKRYVKSVYESMSQGQGGGFEF